MENAAHHASHSQQRIVSLGNGNASQPIHIPNARKEESANTSKEKTRRKRTAATAAAIRSRSCKYLEHNNQSQVTQQQVGVAIEERIVHHLFGVARLGGVEEDVDGVVAFAIEWREEIDEGGEHRSAQ